MNGYNFTERVRKVLALARETASRLGHDHVAPEHIMLGLVHEGEGVAAAVLMNQGIDLHDVRDAIEARMVARERIGRQGLDLPYTSQAKKVLELAMGEARQLNHSYVGTEHLLLALLRTGNETIVEVLGKASGLTIDKARAEVLRLLGAEVSNAGKHRHEPADTTFASPAEAAHLEIDILVRYPDGRVVEHQCKGRFEALRTIASL